MGPLSMENLIVSFKWRYDKRHYESSQQMESRWYRNTIVTKITIAIVTMTMVTERDIGFAVA